MAKLAILHSLHRPYHCPLWIVKWICCFYAKRSVVPGNCFQFDDVTVDMYFTIIEWLKKYCSTGYVGIPSDDALSSVLDYFKQFPIDQRPSKLKYILTHRRNKGFETQIYSTYKAVSYYHNLATDKLRFVDKTGCCCWNYTSFRNFKFKCSISKSDRKIYLSQILKYDGHFFISQCHLYKYIKKYDLKEDDTVFDFLQKFYPTPRFDFVSRSHQNYYAVRKHWIDQLGIVSSTGTARTSLRNCIREDSQLIDLERDIANNIRIYVSDIRKEAVFLSNIKLFYTSYRKKLKRQEDINDFVNLYDICSEMKMSYTRFNAFLEKFYESERKKKNIFLINIVSTIDQRQRFYVRETPVLKIKIS